MQKTNCGYKKSNLKGLEDFRFNILTLELPLITTSLHPNKALEIL